jgi:hypothetical protein
MKRPSPEPRRTARWWTSQRPVIRTRPLTLERLEDRSSPTGLALDVGGALTLGPSDGVMATARVALVNDVPSILYPSDPLGPTGRRDRDRDLARFGRPGPPVHRPFGRLDGGHLRER